MQAECRKKIVRSKTWDSVSGLVLVGDAIVRARSVWISERCL